jgi:hypothetical protein
MFVVVCARAEAKQANKIKINKAASHIARAENVFCRFIISPHTRLRRLLQREIFPAEPRTMVKIFIFIFYSLLMLIPVKGACCRDN